MIQKPKGTKDILPQDSYKWQYIEQKTKELFENYGFKEIRVPVFENTELFQRGVGETTDVVQKEMYTFEDKGGRSITLRPEGTAGVVRAYIENGMASLPSPIKLWYNMSMYRYENVQKGRLREFHQIGAEVFGTESYLADVEIILMANEIFKIFNIPNIELAINSIGCPECRKKYYACNFCSRTLNWRSVACSFECYQKYTDLVIAERSKGKTNEVKPERKDMTEKEVDEL